MDGARHGQHKALVEGAAQWQLDSLLSAGGV
jgi:hypothetical protein